MILVRPPGCRALAPFVEYLGYFEGPPPAHLRERILPGGWADLMVSLSDAELGTYEGTDLSRRLTTSAAVLSGPTRRFKVIDTSSQRAIMCVHFRMGGAFPFFPAPVSAVTGSMVGLGELWGRDGDVLRERLLEACTPVARLQILESTLLAHTVRSLDRDLAVDHAIEALEHGSRVHEVIACFGTTAKPFIRRFTERVGLTPKRFARVRRLQRVLASLPPDARVDWAEVAASHGFSDQSHFVHDFRDLTGIPPGGYQSRSPSDANHVAL